MQSQPQAWASARASSTAAFQAGASDHEAGIGQNAVLVGVQYAGIDLSGQAEVVPR